jgi:uncharacterized membrane protein YedE/YeeE
MNEIAMSQAKSRLTSFRRALSALVSGALFAVGLALGGMTQPAKVVGFLDIFTRFPAARSDLAMSAAT